VVRCRHGDVDDRLRAGARGQLDEIGAHLDPRGRGARGGQVDVDHAGQLHLGRRRDGGEPRPPHHAGADQQHPEWLGHPSGPA
jgi:hypothetical protein